MPKRLRVVASAPSQAGPMMAPRKTPSPESVVRDLIEQTPGVAAPTDGPAAARADRGRARILFMDLDGTLTTG
jgi:hypothetical protein